MEINRFRQTFHEIFVFLRAGKVSPAQTGFYTADGFYAPRWADAGAKGELLYISNFRCVFMVNFDEALAIARNYVKSQPLPIEIAIDGNQISLFENEIIEKYYGWYFLWGTSKYYETNDPKYAYFSNPPILVLKKNGKIIELASAYNLEQNIEKLEKRLSFLERD